MTPQLRRAAVLLTAVLASVVVAIDIRGLPQSLTVAYEGTTFKCLDGSKVIASTAVNDDFCDCADGSDEPGTSACANGKFFCANKGYRGKFVSSSVVNDGVCDCCDGTDELGAPRSGCKNTCDADGAEWRKQQAEAILRAETGARLREEYASAGRAAASVRSAALSTATAALEKARAEKTAAEAAAAGVLAEEKRVGEEKAAAAAASAEASIVASARLGDLDRAALLTLLIEHVRGTNTSAELVARLKGRAGVADPEGIAWVDPASEAGSAGEYRSEAGDAARARLAAATAEESKYDGEVRAATDEGATDFGPDAVFYKLKGQCFELRVNQYTYHTCPFGSAKQDATSLGHFSGWSTRADGSTDYSTMSFKGGQTCWNGPERSFKLVFECGAVDALLSADEPEKCTYAGRFSTPAVCDAKFAQELRLQLDAAGGVLPSS